MKTSTKILIAVCAVVLVAAVVVGVLFAVSSRKPVPELNEEKLRENPISYNYAYVVGQSPYTDRWVFDTPIGLKSYWSDNHIGGNGVEVVLQQSKDGELIMLSEPFPALSNAENLYGKGVQVGDLTLEELRKVNLAYAFIDEEGYQCFAGVSDDQLERVSIVTLDDMLEFFGDTGRTNARIYLRFYDESQIADLGAALKTIYDGLTSYHIETKTVFCPQSDAAAQAADTACPDLARAATSAEAKALLRDCNADNTPDDLPYTTIYEKAKGQIAGERFIHYARNLGLAVVLTDIKADDAVQYSGYGVTAIATREPETVIPILNDARSAERESKKAAG